MTRFGCVVLTAGRRPDDLRRAARVAAAPGGRRDRRRRRRQRLGARGPAGRRARRRAGGATTASRPAATRASRTSAASCSSSSTTTRRSRDDDALAPRRGAFAADPALGLVQLGSSARDGGRALPRLGPAAARAATRRAAARSPRCGRAPSRCRRAVFDAVGGWPARVPLRPRGRRPRLARDGRGLPRPLRGRHRRPASVARGAPRTAYSYYFGARNRVWLARRHLPLPLGIIFVAVLRAAHRAPPEFRRAVQEAVRGYRDGMRGPGTGAQPAAGQDAVADDPRRPPADHVTSDPDLDDRPAPSRTTRTTARTTSRRSTTSTSRTSSGCRRSGPYFREVWRRREFAFELSRTKLRAQHFDTVFGQLWLVLNPLLLACVYFVLVDILRGGSSRPGFFAHLVVGVFAYHLVSDAVREGTRSVVSGGRLILNTAFPRVLLPLGIGDHRGHAVPADDARLHPDPPASRAAVRPGRMLWVVPLTVAAGRHGGRVRDVRRRRCRSTSATSTSFMPYVLRIWLYVSPILYFADADAREVPVVPAQRQPDGAAAAAVERRRSSAGHLADDDAAARARRAWAFGALRRRLPLLRLAGA